MREPEIPKLVSEVVATLTEIFRAKGRTAILEVLENAHAHFDETDFDNWNGGTYTWALRLEVPVTVFAAIEPRLSEVEKEIGDKLGYITRLHPNDHVGEVSITPVAPGSKRIVQRTSPPDHEVRRIWPDGRFRLFLSHVSKHKRAISKLRAQLGLRGIAAFVAHEDIEPSREWQQEIELALRSMHALAAVLTPDFHDSKWTDQEIGWALGRGVAAIPVRLGLDPYGLVGKFQGVRGTLDQPEALAVSIAKILLKNSQTHGEMRRSLVASFRTADSHIMAQALRKILVTVTDFTEDEKTSLRNACTENKNVAEAYYVPEAIYKVVGHPPQPTAVAVNEEDVPF